MMGQCYIYVIGIENGHQKIGISANPNKRLKTLQTSNANKLILNYTIQVESREKALIIESLIHKQLKYNRLSGEWFDITKETAIGTVDYAIIMYDSLPVSELKHNKRNGLFIR
jgi:predicted GIY-YIG superfamily endonuclease